MESAEVWSSPMGQPSALGWISHTADMLVAPWARG